MTGEHRVFRYNSTIGLTVVSYLSHQNRRLCVTPVTVSFAYPAINAFIYHTRQRSGPHCKVCVPNNGHANSRTVPIDARYGLIQWSAGYM